MGGISPHWVLANLEVNAEANETQGCMVPAFCPVGQMLGLALGFAL